MTTPGKPTVTPDDGMILVPEGTPKGWRVYSVQPDATDERMRRVAAALNEQGLHNEWWIQGRGVFLVDCRADHDPFVVATIEGAWD
jgi:hypothetical protein